MILYSTETEDDCRENKVKSSQRKNQESSSQKSEQKNKRTNTSMARFSEKFNEQSNIFKKTRATKKDNSSSPKKHSLAEGFKKKLSPANLIGMIGKLYMRLYQARHRIWRSKLDNLNYSQMVAINDLCYPLESLEDPELSLRKDKRKVKAINFLAIKLYKMLLIKKKKKLKLSK